MGSWSGAVVCCIITCMHLMWCIWESVSPSHEIEVCHSVCDLILNNDTRGMGGMGGVGQGHRESMGHMGYVHRNQDQVPGSGYFGSRRGSNRVGGGRSGGVSGRESPSNTTGHSHNPSSTNSDNIGASHHRVNRQFLTSQHNNSNNNNSNNNNNSGSSQPMEHHGSASRGSHRTRELLQRK